MAARRQHAQAAPSTRGIPVVQCDIVAQDSQTKEKTAAASSRGFDGRPHDPSKMQQSTPAANKLMQEKMDLVKQDFQYCWKHTLTRENFVDDMYFEDPISKYTNYIGYKANIVFLRNFLAPIYEIWDIKQDPDNEWEMLVRWSFTMQFWFNRWLPTKVIWDPRLVFTGITVLGVDPKTGKFNKHVDLWDSNQNNKFFSVEGFVFVLRQMINFSKPPNLPTPEFAILKKYKAYEIRRYKPFLIAEVSRSASGQGSEDPTGGDKGSAFKTLAGYLGKGNDRGQEIKMSTPVFSDRNKGTMQFYLGEGFKGVDDLPKPKDGSIKLREHPGGLYAADVFAGNVNSDRVQQRERELRNRLQQDGTRPSSDDWILAQYNVPWQLPFFKRNEILVPLDEKTFNLW
jgi:hypothetical protein